MAHVHGADAAKGGGHGGHKNHDGHDGHGMSGKTGGGGMGATIASMGSQALAKLPAAAECPEMAAKAALAGGAALSVASNSGKGLVARFFTNPWMLFGLGFAAGFLVCRYRQEIISAAQGKSGIVRNFGSARRQSLEDLVAECGECAGREDPPQAQR